MLNLILMDFLKLKLGKAFQSILHFFARLSAQPPLGSVTSSQAHLLHV
jgi:hypothetical protein